MKKFDFLNERTKSIQAYVPGEQPQTDDWTKLNTNENPYSPSPLVSKELSHLAENVSVLCKYPHPFGEPLRSTIADYYNLDSNQVLVCNGSDEALYLICQAVLGSGVASAYSKVTYSLYSTLVQLAGGEEIFVDMNESEDNPFGIDLQKLEGANSDVVFLPNPNAQTGEYVDIDAIKDTISKSEKLWVIDEAYNDFAGEACSMTAYLPDLQNLVVIRTFSKSHGLAGLRLGYALSMNKELMSGLYGIKDSYNIDAVAIRLGVAAFKDKSYYDGLVAVNSEQRIYLNAELEKIGFKVIQSKANFLLVKHKSLSVIDIFEKLKVKKILVRHFKKSMIEKYLRITIGNSDQNLILIKALKEIIL